MGVEKNMKANKKFVEEDEAVSAVIGVILMVAITVAIAATVYVYVSGLASSPGSDTENASVAAEGTDDQIKLVLASGGDDYDDGYTISTGTDNEVTVFIDGSKVTFTSNTWETGGQLLIGLNGATWSEGNTCAGIEYEVTVSIKNTVVFDGTIRVG
jgi:flagellin-like protein